MLLQSDELKLKWKDAVRWLGDELERVSLHYVLFSSNTIMESMRFLDFVILLIVNIQKIISSDEFL